MQKSLDSLGCFFGVTMGEVGTWGLFVCSYVVGKVLGVYGGS